MKTEFEFKSEKSRTKFWHDLNNNWYDLRQMYRKNPALSKKEKKALKWIIEYLRFHAIQNGVAITEGLGALGYGSLPLDDDWTKPLLWTKYFKVGEK